jgi:nucleotide-binding universal stress UspA family protein
MEASLTQKPGSAGAEQRATRVFDDVLCAVDGTPDSIAAVDQAATLATPGGSLTLLAVTAETGSGRYRSAAISPARVDRILSRAAEVAHAHDVQTARLIDPEGPPAESILAEAARHELLAIGAPTASPLAAILVGSVGHAALEGFVTPLLAAQPLRGEAALAESMLVASDGSDASRRVIEVACRIAAARARRVMLLHAAGVESQARPHRIESQASALEAACPGVSELLVETLGPREAIVRAARDFGASLVVLGSRRLGGVRALGSVSRHVMREAPGSVLVVPPAD